MGLLLEAQDNNWGLHTVFGWDHTRYELHENGGLRITVKYYDTVVDTVVRVSEKDMRSIRRSIPEKPVTDEIGACDGDGWSFTAYDEEGNITFQFESGYIYGIKPLQRIGRILESYIPEYDEPKYDEDILSRLH